MKRTVIAGLALAAAGVYLLPGCGEATSARVEFAKKKALDRLDDLLGKMDVERAEIDAGIRATRQAVEGVRKARIKAQVTCDQTEEKAEPFEEKVAKCDQTLVRLRDLLQAGKPAEVGGKTYAVADLTDMADRVIQARKDAVSQVGGFRSARDQMRQVVTNLTKTQQSLEGRLATLQAQVAKLDAEMAAAKAMRETAAGMGDGDATLAASLDRLEEKVAGLSADVRAELRGEEEKFQVATADKAVSDVDAFIRDSQQPADRVAEIDRILGGAAK